MFWFLDNLTLADHTEDKALTPLLLRGGVRLAKGRMGDTIMVAPTGAPAFKAQHKSRTPVMVTAQSPDYSLWLSCALPSDSPSWELMATGSREKLEEVKLRLVPFAAKRRIVLLQGKDKPRWSPKL